MKIQKNSFTLFITFLFLLSIIINTKFYIDKSSFSSSLDNTASVSIYFYSPCNFSGFENPSYFLKILHNEKIFISKNNNLSSFYEVIKVKVYDYKVLLEYPSFISNNDLQKFIETIKVKYYKDVLTPDINSCKLTYDIFLNINQ